MNVEKNNGDTPKLLNIEKRETALVRETLQKPAKEKQTDSSLSFASQTYYFSPKELSRKPLVMHDLPMDFTLHVHGIPDQAAVLQILINEYGDVDNVIVEDSHLPEDAQRVVLNAFSKIRFYPGEIAGTPVKSQLKIEVILTDPQSRN